MRSIALLVSIAVAAGSFAAADVPRLTARTLRVYEAPDADQGVAADTSHFYVVDNSVIAKHDIAKGVQVARWDGSKGGLINHMNSCIVMSARLWCANSNYPNAPMGSSIEVFDTKTLDHIESRSLGMLDEGSITWFDRFRNGFIAGFAHYDGNGSVGFKNSKYSSVVVYDAEWRKTGGWLFPTAVIERMAPYAASGGAIGPDGYLYLLGHDRPEMYVVGRPAMGPIMIHIATIDLENEGQAFSWAQDGSRTVFTIDRRKKLVRSIAIPPIPAIPPAALPFK